MSSISLDVIILHWQTSMAPGVLWGKSARIKRLAYMIVNVRYCRTRCANLCFTLARARGWVQILSRPSRLPARLRRGRAQGAWTGT